MNIRLDIYKRLIVVLPLPPRLVTYEYIPHSSELAFSVHSAAGTIDVQELFLALIISFLTSIKSYFWNVEEKTRVFFLPSVALGWSDLADLP